ncbi:MAG: demethoxyubiquinone hydroxylase family protein [Rickettsiales bacterium]
MKKTLNKQALESIIRVNQAGEFGAKRIYEGQLAILTGNKKIQHMYEQELEHLKYFDQQRKARDIKPTIFTPLWNLAGFALGAGTALLGEKAAMACTVAVEEVIDEHYQEQLSLLNKSSEKELYKKIEKFRAEELEHRDTGLEYGAKEAPAYNLLTQFVRCASKTAIFLSKRV